MTNELDMILLKIRVSRMENKQPQLVNARLYAYEIETTQAKNMWADASHKIALPNPVLSNCRADFPDIFLDHKEAYRIVLTDNQGNEVLSKDLYNENI